MEKQRVWCVCGLCVESNWRAVRESVNKATGCWGGRVVAARRQAFMDGDELCS